MQHEGESEAHAPNFIDWLGEVSEVLQQLLSVRVLRGDAVLQQHRERVELPHEVLVALVAESRVQFILDVRVDGTGSVGARLEAFPDVPVGLDAQRLVRPLARQVLNHQHLK